MNNCWRSIAARLESDQPKVDFICRYFRISMAINAVHTFVTWLVNGETWFRRFHNHVYCLLSQSGWSR